MEIYIRPLEENDAKISYVWRNDPEIWKYTGSAPDKIITLDDELTWIRRVIKDDTCRRFAIIADNEYVGNIYLTDIHDAKAEYHIFIGNKEYTGKGIAKEASKLIIDFARDILNLSSVTLEVRPENTRAVQLYLSLGFKVVKEEEFLNMSIDL
ncbi:MAG: GNAT family N-acetyltransferase [Candidatus Saccharimonadaceae bacterium]